MFLYYALSIKTSLSGIVVILEFIKTQTLFWQWVIHPKELLIVVHYTDSGAESELCLRDEIWGSVNRHRHVSVCATADVFVVAHNKRYQVRAHF